MIKATTIEIPIFYIDQFMADLSFENQFEDTEFNSNSSIENAGKDNY